MSYTALYRKYRPTNFDEIAGQQTIVQTLKNAVLNDRIAHAYLFCGPRGTGKTSTAKIFARAINCTSPDEVICDKCENCQTYLQGEHPDIIEIDAASNNGVEEVRNLIEKVKYAPLKGKYKVYIIDEVHMMSKSAYNALLKTIEEPPKHVVFIFATTEPHKVLPTILSRCQRYDFHKVAKKEMVERLSQVCKAEKIQVDVEALELIADLSDGGMRDALSILDQCYAYNCENIRVDDVLEVYGVVSIDEQINLLQSIDNGDVKRVMEMIENFSVRGIDIKRLTASLISVLKDKLIAQMSGLKTILNDEQITLLSQTSDKYEDLNKIDVLMETYSKYQFASDDEAYFEIACIKMMEQKNNKMVEVKEVKATLKTKIVSDSEKKEVERVQEIPANANKGTADLTKENIVSRETYDEEMLLSLLAGADKNNKSLDNKALLNNDLYLNDLEFGKYANLIKNIVIVASSSNYLVVSSKENSIVNQINKLNEKNEFNNYSEVLFGTKKKIFAIDDEQTNDLLSAFRKRMNNNDLPKPIEITIDEDENEKLNNVKKIFGENLIVEE